MKRLFSIKNMMFGLAMLLSLQVFSQAKKPTLMVVPSDNWCIKNGFSMKFDNQGIIQELPDYEKALQQNSDLLLVIAKINELMADRGFPLKNLESELKKLKSQSAEDALLMSKGGGDVNESPIDKLKKTAKADIIIQLTYTVNQTGPKRSITYILQGLDAYTGKQIAGSSGTGAPSFATEMPILLEEAVLTHIDNFTSQLQTHFDDMFANGREIVVRVKVFGNWGEDLETEFDGKELSAHIEDWIAQNSLKGRYSASDVTENMMLFEQVRIPLYDANNRAIDARVFCRDLQNYLKAPPFNITNKLMTQGLGQAQIVLGDK